MKVQFWGTRGSIPTPGSDTVKYGGNTSCIQITSDNNQQLILDMGTGIRELGMKLCKTQQPLKLSIFISHTHWDHINGFPFFGPAFIKGNIIDIYGPVHYEKSLPEIISSQMEYSYFPVRIAELNAEINYHQLKEESLEVGDFKIETKYMNHPVLTLGYKITANNKTVIYTGDTEPYYNFLGDADDDDDLEGEDTDVIIKEENERMVRFVKGTDLLISDSQYTDKEYETKKGWGHSPLSHVLKMTAKAEVPKLVLFHHDPLHTDEDIDNIVKTAKEWIKNSDSPNIEVRAAREKDIITL